MRIIGLDCSSKTFGYGVLDLSDTKITYIDSGYFSPPKKNDDNLFFRLASVRKELNSIFQKHKPDRIVLEDILAKVNRWESNATTSMVLCSFNRCAGLVAYDYLQMEPDLLAVSTIRRLIKVKDTPSKEEIPELVAHHLGINFPWEKNKQLNVKEECFDRADGIAAALALAIKLKGGK